MNANYELYEQQHDFVASLSRFTAFIGGVASGKTWAGAVKSLITMLENPSWKTGIIVAPTYGMLLDATWVTCLECWGDLVARHVTSPLPEIQLVTGQRILFRSADDPEKLRGPNLWWAWIDEGAYCHKNTWTRLIARLRAGGLAGPAWITTTPNQLNWVHELLKSGRIEVYEATTLDNPYTSPEFVADLIAMYPGELAKQELYGKFIQFGAGIIRGDWFKRISRAHVPPELRYHRFWDVATSIKTTADLTASVRAAHFDNAVLLSRPIMGRWTWPNARKEIIATTRQELGSTIALGVESNGFQLAAVQDLAENETIKRVGLFPVSSDRDKLARALPWIGQAAMGSVYLIEEPSVSWNSWIEQLEGFPEAEHDDAVDATSGAVALEGSIPRRPKARVRGGGAAV